MARTPKVSWHAGAGAFRSDVGEPVTSKDGRTRRSSVYFKGIPKNDRRRAQEALEAYLKERQDHIVRSGDWTLGQIVQLYLAHSEASAAPLTFKGHGKVLAKLLRFQQGGKPYRDKFARDFTATDLGRVVNAWVKAPYKPNYIARMVSSIQAALNWAAAPVPDRNPERLIETNPIKGFTHDATRAARAPDRFAPDHEVKAFLEFIRARAQTMPPLVGRFEQNTADLIEVAALTGARPGELRVAEWRDFEPVAVELPGEVWGKITLDKDRWKAGKKTGQIREVYLPPDAVAIIEQIRSHPDHHPVFIWTHKRGARAKARGAEVRAHGEPWLETSLPHKITKLRRLAIAAGVPLEDKGENRFVLYRLRHTAAARLLMAGVAVATVAKLLGTSPDMITRTYQSFLGSHLAEAASKGLNRKTDSTLSLVSDFARAEDDSSHPNQP